jgi:hypothetical protein
MKYIIILTAITISAFAARKVPIQGAWQVVEIQTVKADGSYTVSSPTESLVYFGRGYYSFCWTSHNNPSRSWQMADSTKLNRFNQSIINTGTYKLEGDLLTTSALFAQNPMFVGGQATFHCNMHGDTLVLTGISVNSSENIKNPVYAAGSHIVNKLVRRR